MHDGMGWWMVLMPIMWIVLWGSILWLFVSTIRPGRRAESDVDAMEIARRRYAAGTISRNEFERIRAGLRTAIDDQRGLA
jgi:uncharacterized membrane protein